MLSNLFKEIRYGMRSLLKRPGFTAIVVFTLALGIGANTAIFSVVNAFLLRPLPYRDPDRLVMVESQNRGASIGVSFADYQDWRAQNQAFADIAFFNLRWNANLELSNETETLSLTFGTPNLFSTLGVTPAIGHGPQPDVRDTVLISDGLWRRRYSGDPKILGRQLRIDGQSLTVIGVMPPDFRFPFQTDLWWLTDHYFDSEHRGQRRDQTIARLRPGVTVGQARAEMEQIAARLAQTYPDTNAEVAARVTPLREFWVGHLRTSFWLLLGACGFVLLIACANVANLFLARATARERELAIRAALGAGRWQLIRQTLVESLLLGLAGGAGGVLLGSWSLVLLERLLPSELLPFFIKINLDWRVLTFTFVLSLFAAVTFGLIPAVRSTAVDLNLTLKQGAVSRIGGHARLRALLVVTEIALAIVLLIGAGLMLRSFRHLQGTTPGFAADNVLHLEINPSYPRREDYNVGFMSRRYQQLLQRVAAVPGVVAVAANSDPPFVGQKPWYRGELSLEGQPIDQRKSNPLVNYQSVSADYFRVLQIPLLRGRVFTEQDALRADGRRDVAIVNQRLAQILWPNTDPIGKRLNCDEEDNACATVVGIVGDVKHNTLKDEAGYDLYYSCYQSYNKQIHFIARTQGEPLNFATSIKQAIWEVSPDTGIFNVVPVARLSTNTVWQSRLWGLLFGIFSAVALALAAAGIYGVMSWFVAQRTHEIGIRMSLGAQARDVLLLVVAQGMKLTFVGVAVGLVGSYALTRLMNGLLFGVTATDSLTFALVAIGSICVALLACYVPARRATRVDPLVALRHE
jgi:putative ABC transport system permease protein